MDSLEIKIKYKAPNKNDIKKMKKRLFFKIHNEIIQELYGSQPMYFTELNEVK